MVTASHPLKLEKLVVEQTAEVLEFLAKRPLHTVFMAGIIRDNGLISPLNRGSFYACRNETGAIEGVALIGHAVLVEAHTEVALTSFALLAQSFPRAHMIMGEQEKIEHFWHHYSAAGQAPRLVTREFLYEQTWPVMVGDPVPGLRPATLEHLPHVMSVNARMAFEESGINPLETDPVGFRLRCARRIEQGRVWVWCEDGRLIFKSDIVADTRNVIYLEGIYVNPEDRGKGYGLRCLSQLSRNLLARTSSVAV
ncbi:MAG: GNAT family N-acetyltransferase, partial [Pyrinomonadaceae bacterium]